MLGHVHHAQRNAGPLGALVGVLAGTAVGVGLYTEGSTIIKDMGSTGFNVGSNVGGVMYSVEMEREADHVAAYIVHEAGYDMEAGRTMWVRLAREVRGGTVLGMRAMRGYFRTHADHRGALRRVGEEHPGGAQRAQRRPLTLKERWTR